MKIKDLNMNSNWSFCVKAYCVCGRNYTCSGKDYWITSPYIDSDNDVFVDVFEDTNDGRQYREHANINRFRIYEPLIIDREGQHTIV